MARERSQETAVPEPLWVPQKAPTALSQDLETDLISQNELAREENGARGGETREEASFSQALTLGGGRPGTGAHSLRNSEAVLGSCALIPVSDRVAVLAIMPGAPIRALCVHMGPL